MGLRHLSRRLALTLLCLQETEPDRSPEETVELCLANFAPSDDGDNVLAESPEPFQQALPFGQELFEGVMARRPRLDPLLQWASDNWRLERMSRVDRNILRLAVYEMLFREDIPPKVSVDEAVELGKEFGSEDSGAFINGLLDKILREKTAGTLPRDLTDNREAQG